MQDAWLPDTGEGGVKKGWVCRKVGCGVVNEPAAKKCVCGRLRPKKRVPEHKKALRDFDYAYYLQLNEDLHNRGENCAICSRPPKTRRLDRDHCHTTGKPRGLLCARCNQRLERGSDNENWLSDALEYIRRANRHWEIVV